jgi:hypothetical protein
MQPIWALCGTLVLISGNALAQDCGAILQHGVWELSVSSSSLERDDSFAYWLCSAEKNDKSSSLGIEVPGYRKLDFSNSGSHHNKLCRSSSDGSHITGSGLEFATKASSAVADAWSKCINGLGGHASVIYGRDPRRFGLMLQYAGKENNDSEVSLVVIPTASGNASCTPVNGLRATPNGLSGMITRVAVLPCQRYSPLEQVQIAVAFAGGGGETVLNIPDLTLDAPPPDEIWCIPLRGNTSTPYNSGWNISNGNIGTCRHHYVEPLGQSLPAGTVYRFQIECHGSEDPKRILVDSDPVNKDRLPDGCRIPATFANK